MQILDIESQIKQYDEMLKIFEDFKFTHFDRIELSAEKNKFENWNPELRMKLKTHPKSKKGVITYLLNNGKVTDYCCRILSESEKQKYKLKGYKTVESLFDRTKSQNIENGSILFTGNSVKLRLNRLDDLDNNESIIRQIKNSIKYLIDNNYLVEYKTDDYILDHYLNKWHFNEVELNFFFDNFDLFNLIKSNYSNLDYENALLKLSCQRRKFKVYDDERKAVEKFINSNKWDTSCYLWFNTSSKCIIYNVTAKEDGERKYSLPGDIFKIELCLKRCFFKDNNIKLDFNLTKNIENYGIFKKVKKEITQQIIDEKALFVLMKYILVKSATQNASIEP